MKIIAILSIIFLLSCKKKVEKPEVFSRVQLEQIKEPQLFLDSLGSGELSGESKIVQIQRYFYGANNNYYFEYFPNEKKIKSIFYKPEAHPRSCAFGKCEFFYRDNRIDKIEISSPSSGCEIIIKTYQFAYFPIGALKSVIQTDDFNIIETFFSYDTAGRINKIFRNGRNKSDLEYKFSETGIRYDPAGNVEEITLQPQYSNTIAERISYTYDKAKNPFRQVYIPQEFLFVFGWSEGIPFYLSANVVSLTTRFYESNSATHSLPYTITTSDARLHTFYYFNQFGSKFYYQ